jgi:hypothetical protein
MRGYLIDPKQQTVSQIDFETGVQGIKTILGCDDFAYVAYLGGFKEKTDHLIVSNDFLLEDRPKEDLRYWFQIDAGCDPPSSSLICDLGLVSGADVKGESCEPTITLDEVRKRVTFMRRVFKGFATRSGDNWINCQISDESTRYIDFELVDWRLFGKEKSPTARPIQNPRGRGEVALLWFIAVALIVLSATALIYTTLFPTDAIGAAIGQPPAIGLCIFAGLVAVSIGGALWWEKLGEERQEKVRLEVRIVMYVAALLTKLFIGIGIVGWIWWVWTLPDIWHRRLGMLTLGDVAENVIKISPPVGDRDGLAKVDLNYGPTPVGTHGR